MGFNIMSNHFLEPTRNQEQFTKENAFLTAIVSSGILHTITKNCSRGDIKACKCHPKPQSLIQESVFQTVEILGQSKPKKEEMEKIDWTWGGCSDDTTYGNAFSKYITSRNNDSTNAIVEHHNNKIGRQVIRESMVKKCRCHGVSGSCSLQTCWVQIAPFYIISAKLKEKYNKAILVNSEQFAEERNRTIRELKNNLVYLDQSPNYCHANNKIDWPGTKGRTCSRSYTSTTIAEKRSCRHLCRSCGLRVRQNVRKVLSKCKCTFAWCCEVKCQSCKELVTDYVCE
ncbi:unnamed protein product [Brassicogethes aeneus]|uniref:Protein Wnt n=1 Tax=Brassicogethes aeneus TaxID=1431903 RepID=A0A9P0FIZ3_BRAAE|nr:unnamed protein product [Brassicogethes aeneus]